MKKFAFRFEPILKIRQDREQELMNELAELLGDLARINRELEELRKRQIRFEIERELQMKEGMEASELKRSGQTLEYFRNTRDDLIYERTLAERRVDDKKQELMEAMKERKIMDRLKEKALEEYIEEFEKEESKIIDEIVTYRASGRGEQEE